MAKIANDDKQLQALEEIESDLKTINLINLILVGKGEYTIAFNSNEDKKSAKVTFEADSPEEKKIEKIFIEKKRRLAKQIESKAKKYKIVLDEKDKISMSDSLAKESTETREEN